MMVHSSILDAVLFILRNRSKSIRNFLSTCLSNITKNPNIDRLIVEWNLLQLRVTYLSRFTFQFNRFVYSMHSGEVKFQDYLDLAHPKK